METQSGNVIRPILRDGNPGTGQPWPCFKWAGCRLVPRRLSLNSATATTVAYSSRRAAERTPNGRADDSLFPAKILLQTA